MRMLGLILVVGSIAVVVASLAIEFPGDRRALIFFCTAGLVVGFIFFGAGARGATPSRGPVRTVTSRVETVNKRFVIEKDGQRREYTSAEDLPDDVRDKLEQMRATGGGETTIRIVVNGEERTFRSWDEVPEPYRSRLRGGIGLP